MCFYSRSSGEIPAAFKQQQRPAAQTQTAAEDRGPPEERRSTAGGGGGGGGGEGRSLLTDLSKSVHICITFVAALFLYSVPP